MRTTTITIVLSLSSAGLIVAEDPAVDAFSLFSPTALYAVSNYVTVPAPKPIGTISPEDVEQGSIEVFEINTSLATTKNFIVRWRYTEEGAKKVLAFWREHAGHEVITRIGSFEWDGPLASLKLRPAGWTDEGWLERRTDKFFGASEDDAKRILTGLKKK
jgi:hypothetical protein